MLFKLFFVALTVSFSHCATKQMIVETSRPERPEWTQSASRLSSDDMSYAYTIRVVTDNVQELGHLKTSSKKEVVETFKQQFIAQVPFHTISTHQHSMVQERLENYFDLSFSDWVHLRDVYFERRLNNTHSETIFYLQYDISKVDFDRFITQFLSQNKNLLAFQYNGFQIQSH